MLTGRLAQRAGVIAARLPSFRPVKKPRQAGRVGAGIGVWSRESHLDPINKGALLAADQRPIGSSDSSSNRDDRGQPQATGRSDCFVG